VIRCVLSLNRGHGSIEEDMLTVSLRSYMTTMSTSEKHGRNGSKSRHERNTTMSSNVLKIHTAMNSKHTRKYKSMVGHLTTKKLSIY